MSLFDAIAGLQKLAESPDLARTANAIGQSAAQLPELLSSICKSLKRLDEMAVAQYGVLTDIRRDQQQGNATLVEISLGLDNLTDPIKRPPFHASDVEAMMQNQWPIDQAKFNNGFGSPGEGEPVDCTDLTEVKNGE
jgi:hypothetical protein